MSLGSIHRTAHKRRSGSDRLRSMAPTCLNARSRSIPSIMHSREQKIDLRQSGPDFARRHIGPNENEAAEMLGSLGFETLNALIDATVRLFAGGTVGSPRQIEIVWSFESRSIHHNSAGVAS